MELEEALHDAEERASAAETTLEQGFGLAQGGLEREREGLVREVRQLEGELALLREEVLLDLQVASLPIWTATPSTHPPFIITIYGRITLDSTPVSPLLQEEEAAPRALPRPWQRFDQPMPGSPSAPTSPP